MDNVKGLREDLRSVMTDLRSGTLDVKIAAEMNNSAGKVINTVKVQLEYAHLRKEKPVVDFMKCH